MHTRTIIPLIMVVLSLVGTAAFAQTCPPSIVKGKSLVIRFPTVVDDPVRTVWTGATTTTSDGAWSFGRLMFNMAGSQHAPTFVRRWLEQWEADRGVNSFTVPARPSIRSLVIDPWPRHPTGNLNLSKAPMRLLAIVYRPDLRDLAQGKAGEGRFVFGLLDEAKFSFQFTVILEYILPAKTATEVKNWAVAFQRLSTLPHGPTFNAELEKITNRFAGKNVAPTRINGSAISQVRTNEITLDSPWELREFRLNASDKLLREVTVRQTPDLEFNSTNIAALARWVDANAAAILGLTGKGSIEVPLSFEGRPFRAGASVNNIDVWDSITTNRSAMFRVAINTCNGCHGAETNTSFLHITPREPGSAARLSEFLSGPTTNPDVPSTKSIAVADPRDGSPTRLFNELEFRVKDMAALLCPAAASESAATMAIIEEADPLGRAVTGDPHRGPSVGLAH
jgi:hypothetical protein